MSYGFYIDQPTEVLLASAWIECPNLGIHIKSRGAQSDPTIALVV